MATLQACMDDLNTHGAVGALRWSDGFAVPLGTIVYVATTPIDGTDHFAFVYAVLDFDKGGEHHSGYHVHHIVNWSAEDPPFIFEVIDDEGRSLEFTLLESNQEAEQVAARAAWLAELAANPARREKKYGDVMNALASMSQHFAARAARE